MALKYNLGCGFKKLSGFINVDMSKEVEPDVLADVRVVPWGWAKSNSADLIWADNLVEHIERGKIFINFIKECHRVLQNGGVLRMKIPILTVDNLLAVFSDPTHVNQFTIETFDYFDMTHVRWKMYGRAYGIPKFTRTENRRDGRWLFAKLKAVK